ncbi:MAG: 2-amino-4-hydroxy-6-hydroxymethyldihydropteridine diphosphokinase [Rhodospirillales bacterium 20-60-12]|nr:MAG: 2-amino-4-hydroxy-6-hydroxymethyldihydropteridine diphosphokinase [Rhodospirillales bacterium 20-60-12]HQT67414.1 2-amino-4-hydroxy-6-hydroxymethyldihydropteridine diphosphokinase [Acetobacteraceae bacterium]
MILIAIGGNLPDENGLTARQNCPRAANLLGNLPGLRLIAVSPWYRAAPVPASDQPDYCNGVVRLDGDAEPAALLAALHAIEARFGRVRSVLNEARPLDLDLIDCHGAVIDEPRLVLPHPRAHMRRFVMQPLVDVAPDWVHPRLGITASAILAGLPGPALPEWKTA